MKKEDAFEDLRMRIISGGLVPGQWLVERELGEAYRLSRTPIRETLRKLSNIGIVELEPSKGYQVKKLRIEEIMEIFHAREAVEGESARLACIASSRDFAGKIRELRERLEPLDIRKNSAEGVVIGNQIHNLIVETANNRYLSEFYHKLSNLMALTRNMSKNSPAIEENSKNAHLAILKALQDKDPAGCEKLMREHLRTTCRALVANHLNLPDRIVMTEEVSVDL